VAALDGVLLSALMGTGSAVATDVAASAVGTTSLFLLAIVVCSVYCEL